jgi:hypothetical protein
MDERQRRADTKILHRIDGLVNKLFVIYSDVTIRLELERVQFEDGVRTILTRSKTAETSSGPTGIHSDDKLALLSHNRCVAKVRTFAGVLAFLSEGNFP